jgi:hypothetical protein
LRLSESGLPYTDYERDEFCHYKDFFCESPRNSIFTPGVPASFGVTAIAGIIVVAGIIAVVWHHFCCGRVAGNTDIAGVIAVTGLSSFAKTCRDLCVVIITAVDPAVARLVAHPA